MENKDKIQNGEIDFSIENLKGKRTRTIDFETIVNNPQINYNDEVINNWTTCDVADFITFLENLKKEGKHFDFIDFPKWVYLKQQYRELYEEYDISMGKIKTKTHLIIITSILVIILSIVFKFYYPLALLFLGGYLLHYYNVTKVKKINFGHRFVKSILDRMDPYSDKPISLSASEDKEKK